jgi:O-methyltransferase
MGLRNEKETLLLALYLRARDSEATRPILGDHYAAELVKKIDYDFGRLRSLRGNTRLIASRARQLDLWTERFLAEHPDSLVLHLACGLDSRPLRITRPATSQWIDVDYPDVIALRNRLYDLPPDITTIGTSVTDADWCDKVPTDRPTLILAEGLLMYLTPVQVHNLVERALNHLPSGELAFDGVATWVSKIARWQPSMRRAGTGFDWALTSPRDFANSHPRLMLAEEVSVPELITRTYTSSVAHAALSMPFRLPALRNAMRLVRYCFAEGTVDHR